jgi:multicomponent K+:H+ antiporter subunit C
LFALGTGLGSVAVGYPFLTSHSFDFSLPLVGHVHFASATFFDIGVFALVVGSTMLILTAIAHQSVRGHPSMRACWKSRNKRPRRPRPSAGCHSCSTGRRYLMEIVLAIAIGVLTGSGVWLLLRPRSYQVIMGLALLSYAVNLFIFSMGRQGLSINKVPVLQNGVPTDLSHYADPMPQALVLTAIVIGFAMTALFLVVLLASRGASGNDHVDGAHSRTEQEML